MLTLRTQGLLLQLTPLATRFEEPGGAYLEWLDLHVQIVADGIRAQGHWSAMPQELNGFLRQLQAMDAELRPGQSAELAGAEGGLCLTLHMLERGAMVAEWCFQPLPPDGARATGQCGLDQSFLGGLVQGVQELLAFYRARR